MANKLDQRLNFPSDAVLKKKFRQTVAIKAVLKDGGKFDFYKVSSDAIDEVFGKIEKSDFDGGISSMAPFFAHKQNIIEKILKEERPKEKGP